KFPVRGKRSAAALVEIGAKRQHIQRLCLVGRSELGAGGIKRHYQHGSECLCRSGERYQYDRHPCCRHVRQCVDHFDGSTSAGDKQHFRDYRHDRQPDNGCWLGLWQFSG
ncbi:MAG TPA: hypothetical protein VK473_14635, partial [Terriglobales bacterium]|nr:hypothetical protein [Terriglobales bacterium]